MTAVPAFPWQDAGNLLADRDTVRKIRPTGGIHAENHHGRRGREYTGVDKRLGPDDYFAFAFVDSSGCDRAVSDACAVGIDHRTEIRRGAFRAEAGFGAVAL